MYGTTIRQARIASGLTQAELATNSGIRQQNISAIENDRRTPSVDTLQRLLAGCGHALVAVGPIGRVPLPHPDEPDDVDRSRSPGRPMNPADANRLLMAALAVAEATFRAQNAH